MPRYKLTKTVPVIRAVHDLRQWVMTITCSSEIEGEDVNVFVYQTATKDADSDLFFDVANSIDMEALPIEGNDADPNLTDGAGAGFDNIPFYRASSATFSCNNAGEMERIWNMVKMKVQNLSWEKDAIESENWTEEEFEVR